ncbi:hypothetical protein POTOM_029779 [Populus tomentosa]|uniref:Uncharacterized protein n=1 Tax=Populus tomentosa TaxID=118781 RepID=A0A8X7ZG07_POPTO|nr:hypothetical protein POTOM_029779 [Populus tomentosa]
MLHSRAEAGQPELIALEKASKQNKTDFGREVPVFRKLYSYSAKDNDQPVPIAIFLVNFDKRLEEQLVDLSSLLYDHRLQEAHLNSSEVLQSALFTHQQVSFDLFNPPLDDYLSLVILLQTVYML